MIEWFKQWRKARGERLCASDIHDWESCEPPLNKMGQGDAFALNMTISMFYKWASCRRCGKFGRRISQ